MDQHVDHCTKFNICISGEFPL